ncbi:MAG: hypothetical protein P8Y99_13685 [Calditrichaceae bacterium]|jgi:uncharacterized damage-inducible protein DinB
MKLKTKIAQQMKDIFLERDWSVATSYKTELTDLPWKKATTKLGSMNSIAVLAFHIDYYIAGILNVFENGKLEISDKYSFNMSPIKSQEDWEKLYNKTWIDAEKLAILVKQMPENKLEEVFVDEKYGNYYRNLTALVNHSYYHLGQIVLIKKMLKQ